MNRSDLDQATIKAEGLISEILRTQPEFLKLSAPTEGSGKAVAAVISDLRQSLVTMYMTPLS